MSMTQQELSDRIAELFEAQQFDILYMNNCTPHNPTYNHVNGWCGTHLEFSEFVDPNDKSNDVPRSLFFLVDHTKPDSVVGLCLIDEELLKEEDAFNDNGRDLDADNYGSIYFTTGVERMKFYRFLLQAEELLEIYLQEEDWKQHAGYQDSLNAPAPF